MKRSLAYTAWECKYHIDTGHIRVKFYANVNCTSTLIITDPFVLIITDPHNAHQFSGSFIFLPLPSWQCYNPIRPARLWIFFRRLF